jgi:hypothetical protein
VRVAAGDHKVTVTKAGFAPFERTVQVAGGASVDVDASLEHEKRTGHLTVHERKNQAVRVIVDGVDVGPAPWEGDVDPGAHDVALRSSSLSAPSQHVEVPRGATITVEADATTPLAKLDVHTADRQGFILLDGKPLAEGSYTGDVPAGTHALSVAREGYERYEKRITVPEGGTYSEAVTLHKPASAAPSEDLSIPGTGIYGGFGLSGALLVSGTGNELETSCANLGASSCDTPKALGAGLWGYFGYAWNPIGIEILAGGMYDEATPTAHFTNDPTQANSSANALVVGPPRDEQFQLVRAGGIAALRLRGAMEWTKVRATLAAGFGGAFKELFLIRQSTTTKTTPQLTDRFVPDALNYLAPALSVDGSIQYRATPNTALVLGFYLWLENAGNGARTPGDTTRTLSAGSGSNAAPAPIATPPYLFASGTQAFFGPYLGMQFGP